MIVESYQDRSQPASLGGKLWWISIIQSDNSLQKLEFCWDIDFAN